MIQCFDCNHTYLYLGRESHPGVCPDCGSRCVSLSGEVTVETTDVHEPVIESVNTYLDVVISDGSDREICYMFCIHDGRVARLDVICMDEFELRGELGWPDELLPDEVVAAIEKEGFEVPGRAMQRE